MQHDRSRNANGNEGNSAPLSEHGQPHIEPKPSSWIGIKFWRLVRPYWTSEERWLALALLTATIAFVVVQVYTSVILNEIWGQFFTALQERNSIVFYQSISLTVLFLIVQLTCSVLQTVCSQLLGARWWRWLTNH